MVAANRQRVLLKAWTLYNLAMVVWAWVRQEDISVAAWLLFAISASLYDFSSVDPTLQRRVGYFARGVSILAAAVMLSPLFVSSVPLLRDADIPPFPRAALEVTHTATHSRLGWWHTPEAGYRFVVLRLPLSSQRYARGLTLDPWDFWLETPQGRHDDTFATISLWDACTRQHAVPTNGATSCRIAFVVPSGVDAGVLVYRGAYPASTRVRF